MDIEKEEICWSCQYSDFNSNSGKLLCSADDDQRPEICPFTEIKDEKVIQIDSKPQPVRLGEWRKQVSNS